MIYLKPGTAAYNLLQLMAVVGEFPVSALELLGNRRTYRTLVTHFERVQDIAFTESNRRYTLRLLSVSGKGKHKTVRFYRKALCLLDDLHPVAASYYNRTFSNHHFPGNLEHIGRNHRVAESAAMMQASGIAYIPYRRPPLQKEQIQKCVPAEPSFYFARDFKKLDTAEMNKTMFTRVTGILFYPAGCYAVYNTRDSMMKWSGMGEYKTLYHLVELARMNAGIDDVDSAILFGHGPELALHSLIEQEKCRKAEMRFDRIYRHVHFLPLNRDGIQLLRLLVLENWKERMLRALFPQDLRPAGIPFMEYDAQDNERYILSHIDSDIARIVRLRDALHTTDAVFEILCLPWQTGFLKAYLGNRVKVKQIPVSAIQEAMLGAD